MPCRNGVCWRQGQRPPAAARINVPQPQPVALATVQPRPVASQALPQIQQMGVQQPTNLPVAQGNSMAQPASQLPLRQPRQTTIQQPRGILQRIKEFFTGSPEVVTQLSNLSPEQENLLEQNLLPLLTQRLQPQSQFSFEPIRQQALETYNTQIVPSIAERFTAMGQGAQRGSAFPSALAAGGSQLSRSLAALESQIGLQREEQLGRLLALALNPSYAHNVYNPATTGALGGLISGGGNALGGLASGVGGALGSYAASQALPYILGTAFAL